MPEPTRLHIALRVTNLTASVDFYRRLFRVEPRKLEVDYAKFDLHDPPVNFTLNVVAERVLPRGSLSHLGIELADEEAVRAARELVQALGREIRDEKDTLCCYSRQSKFWVEDPDGNSWEFFTVLDHEPAQVTGCDC